MSSDTYSQNPYDLLGIKEILLDTDKLIDLATTTFGEADVDHSGLIEIDELEKVLAKFSETIGKEPFSKEEVEEIMNYMDADGSGEIDMNEYLFLIKDLLYAMFECGVERMNKSNK